ncbi:hypothetical protein WL29_23645 [Burkholderia ubonensis]|uniref:Uncharacterized protein n=1 Tax=Burkholderia ubonensis TaxID=101571 RepID=A0A106QD71_9BURK|nr:hypothetical protein [Burkholderia ubonensis]KWA84326.1 hypothetical protein WL29_23645 [Burkholderia ubonensis]
MRLPKSPSPEQMAAAYAAGLLRKEQLEHGRYYAGRCRHARVARWHAGADCFIHWRSKFGSRFLERIKHPVDENYFDVFLVTGATEPGDEVIPDAEFEQFAQSIIAQQSTV